MSRLALLSVSDKTGIVEFAGSLAEMGFSIISTGGTAQTLKEAGIAVTPVSELTGFPEILEGRVKTLHPKIHAGILAKADREHMEQLHKLKIDPIELVVVNLYPFKETVARRGVTLGEAIENIDIGGPSMLRSAAKNYQRVTVVVNPARYEGIIAQMKKAGSIDERIRFQLALEAFTHTAEYDMAISNYLARDIRGEEFPAVWFLSGTKKQELRYGENPHQKASFYVSPHTEGTLSGSEQLQGKELSYNNLVDLQAAWSVVQDFSTPAATIIKHTNPCGTALGHDILEAYMRAFAADAISAFGGIIGLNRPVDAKTAREIAKTFMEAVIAPAYSPEALEILADKKNLRILQMGEKQAPEAQYWVEPISGGFLVQQWDQENIQDTDGIKVVSNKQPDQEMMRELLFAWKVVKHVKSNAIVISKNKQTLGVGAGQMNRVGAARIALEQAGAQARGAALASDAFFPFSDTVELAAKQGIKAIIQPGGSIRDEDTILKANEYGLVMVFTGVRHFKH